MGWVQECPNCGACNESVEDILFQCVACDSYIMMKIFDYLSQVLTLDAFEDFHHGSIFNKAVFCLGENQAMLVNNECSLWYNRLGDFTTSV